MGTSEYGDFYQALNSDFDELLELFSTLPKASQFSAQAYRDRFEVIGTWFPAPADVDVLSSSPGGVPVDRLRTPGSRDSHHLVYFHGGGYVGCTPALHREFVSRLARTAQTTAWNVGYRVAPEDPFPAAPQDSIAAYIGLVESGQINPERTVLAGDSAGGGLVVATMMGLRDQGFPLPAGGVCFSPWFDLAHTGESITTNAEYDIYVREKGLRRCADLYLAGHDPKDPMASPLYGDLKGLPPLLIQVGTTEILFSDAARFAAKAEASGMDVCFEPWQDAFHFWQGFAPVFKKGAVATERAAEFINACFPKADLGPMRPDHIDIRQSINQN